LDLKKLTDESEIRALAAAYSDAVRRCDPQQAAATYCEDCELQFATRPNIVGRAAVAAALAQVLPATNFVLQTCGGGQIEVDGDAAKARWSVTEWVIDKITQETRVSLGVYEDTIVRTPAGWRFKRRHFHPYFVSNPAPGRVRGEPVMALAFACPT
jgi:ketosteroid isomerase-like protein